MVLIDTRIWSENFILFLLGCCLACGYLYLLLMFPLTYYITNIVCYLQKINTFTIQKLGPGRKDRLCTLSENNKKFYLFLNSLTLANIPGGLISPCLLILIDFTNLSLIYFYWVFFILYVVYFPVFYMFTKWVTEKSEIHVNFFCFFCLLDLFVCFCVCAAAVLSCWQEYAAARVRVRVRAWHRVDSVAKVDNVECGWAIAILQNSRQTLPEQYIISPFYFHLTLYIYTSNQYNKHYLFIILILPPNFSCLTSHYCILAEISDNIKQSRVFFFTFNHILFLFKMLTSIYPHKSLWIRVFVI